MEGGEAAAVARAQAGDRDAFRELVERHSRTVFRVAYRLTGNERDAEDVVQETFLKVYRHLNRYDGRAGFSTWLHRIASNCAIDQIRRRKASAAGRGPASDDPSEIEEMPSVSPSPDRLAFSAELSRGVSTALEALSPQEKAAFLMRHLEGMPIEEIGRALNLRSNAVKQSVFRAVRKLRRELTPLVGATP